MKTILFHDAGLSESLGSAQTLPRITQLELLASCV